MKRLSAALALLLCLGGAITDFSRLPCAFSPCNGENIRIAE